MTGKPAPEPPKPKNCTDDPENWTGDIPRINLADIAAEMQKIDEHTLEFFKGFW